MPSLNLQKGSLYIVTKKIPWFAYRKGEIYNDKTDKSIGTNEILLFTGITNIHKRSNVLYFCFVHKSRIINVDDRWICPEYLELICIQNNQQLKAKM